MAQKITRDQLGWGVSPDIGKSAAEGQAAGDAANAAFNAQLEAQLDRSEPGNGKPFYPDVQTYEGTDPDSGKVPGKI
jgi:hypothetical protein